MRFSDILVTHQSERSISSMLLDLTRSSTKTKAPCAVGLSHEKNINIYGLLKRCNCHFSLEMARPLRFVGLALGGISRVRVATRYIG